MIAVRSRSTARARGHYRFVLTEAQGGTFVEGNFGIEPHSIGMKVFGALAGRRIMSSWLQSSLENLKAVAERAPAQRA